MLTSKTEITTNPIVRYHELMSLCNRVNFHAPPIMLSGHCLTPGLIFIAEQTENIDTIINRAFENDYIAHFILTGSGTVTIPHQYPVQQGTMILRLPGTEMRLTANKGGLLRLFIHFTISPEIEPSNKKLYVTLPNIVHEVATMTDECRLNLPGWPERAGMLCSILISRCATMLGTFSKAPPISCYSPFLSENIDTYIKNNLGQSIRVENIAEHLGISERTLTRRYATETGYTVSSRILALRLEKACLLLKDTPLPLSDIAIQTGFQYVNNFITVFHRHIGITPREYRLMHQQRLQENNINFI